MKTNKSLLTQAILTALAGLTLSAPALADQYHYKDILVGDRAAGLGGAYTAIADDASGLYYNPAGIVYTSQPKISGSVNAYNYKTTTYKNISLSNPSQEWTRTSSGMVANFFGATQPLGDNATVGFSIAIPNYELEDQSDEFVNITGSKGLSGLLNGTGVSDTSAATATVKRQNIDFNNEDNTTLAGVTYAQTISNDLSFGVTLYGYMRKRETTNWQFVQATSNDSSKTLDGTLYQKIQTSEFGIQPRFGLMWSPADKLSVGLMVQTTMMMSEDSETRKYEKYTLTQGGTTTTLDGNLTAYNLSNIPDLTKGAENDMPVEVNLGVAYFASDRLLYTGDISYASATDTYEQVINFAGGTEYYLSPTWAVRGGLYTNMANTKSDVAKYKDPHVNLFGGSISLSRYTKSSNITLGLNYSTGSGEADLKDSSTFVQDVSVNSLNMFISTSASF